MLTFLFCLAWAVIWLSPRSAADKWLRKLLVEIPADRLPHFSPRSIAMASLLIFALVAVAGLMRGDELALLGQGYPDAVMWLTTIDVATSLDLIVLAWLLSAQLRLRMVVRAARALANQVVLKVTSLTGIRSAFRETRTPERKPIQPANDDPEPWAAPRYPSALGHVRRWAPSHFPSDTHISKATRGVLMS